MQNKYVLEIKNLAVKFELEDGIVNAVNGVDICLKEGETIALVGETGAGKTTTARSVLRIVETPPGVVTADTISVCGNDIMSMMPKQLAEVRGKDVAMIFQDPMTSLNPVMTVGEQIAESIRIHENLSRQAALKRAKEMLEMVGIPGSRSTEYPHQFSGGMKQRAVIAIALSCSPKLLIADEPTTALDVTIQAQVLDLIRNLKNALGTSVVLITHDLGIVAELCDKAAVMYAGRIVEQGTLDDIFNHTLHPYTEGLFGSLPNVADRTAELEPIPGLMPDPTDLPQGCSFAPRCKYAIPKCSEAVPEFRVFEGEHRARCCRYDDPTFHIERGQ